MGYQGPVPHKITAITAATYECVAKDMGTLFTNRGGGALTFTLPAATEVQAGWWIMWSQVAAGDFVLTAPAGLLNAFNNAAATTLTVGQDNEEIGNGGLVVFDGAFYLVFLNLAAEAVTTAVA